MAKKKGLWDNLHAKRKRIASGSGERMRKPGEAGAPTAKQLKEAKGMALGGAILAVGQCSRVNLGAGAPKRR
jgi:hypothetical protein